MKSIPKFQNKGKLPQIKIGNKWVDLESKGNGEFTAGGRNYTVGSKSTSATGNKELVVTPKGNKIVDKDKVRENNKKAMSQHRSAFNGSDILYPVKKGFEVIGKGLYSLGQGVERAVSQTSPYGSIRPTNPNWMEAPTPITDATFQYVLPTMAPSRWVGTIRTGKAPWNPENPGLGDEDTNLLFDIGASGPFMKGVGKASKGVAKGFKYATDVIPKVARFGVSNHTGNWTQFGNNMYRLKPGYIGMNGVGVEKKPISYGYDRTFVANAAKEEFTDKVRRPLINRAANEDSTLADALDKVMSGTTETRFGTGNRTLTEPGPHEVLTGTYWDLKTGQPVVRGSGLLGTEPIPVTATEGTYKSSGNFGNMSSATNSILGGGKYGFRNWNELENYVLNLDLDKQEFNYVTDLINRTKSFENGLTLGPKTAQGLIPKTLRNSEQYQQYLKDQSELSDWLMGNLNFGAKNQRVVFSAPKSQQIIIGESNDPGFATRTANIKMPLKSINGNFNYYKSTKLNERLWPNGMIPEEKISQYNLLSPTDKIRLLIQKDNPQIMFPLHFRGIGPNPFHGMTTMQVRGIRPTFKKGGKVSIK